MPATFTPFSAAHAIVFIACAGAMLALITLGLRARPSPPAALRVHRAWLAIVAAVQVANLVYFALPRNLNPGTSLPLHICDLAGLVAFFALATPLRVLRAVLYYWGLGLSTQAFVTPTVDTGPDTFKFYLFFASHVTIVASALYDVVVLRFRPTWRDYGLITLVSLIYLALILPFDLALGFNYGYVGDTRPERPTLIDRLGPWPLRLLWMFLISQALFAALTALWMLPVARRRHDATAASIN